MKFYKARVTDKGLVIEKIVHRSNKPKDGKMFIYLDENTIKEIDKEHIRIDLKR